MMFISRVLLILCVVRASSLSPLPRLNTTGPVTISGISSGADVAAQWHVANSDICGGSAIFAGQAPGCAVMRMDGEPQFTCAEEPTGPGCVGLPPFGAAPCVGCDNASATLAYDHCKSAIGAPLTQVARLVARARALERAGAIPPLANLADDRVFLYHGTADHVYNPPSVNMTEAFFAALGVAATRFEAGVASGHCWPSADAAIPAATCGGRSRNAMENCGDRKSVV